MNEIRSHVKDPRNVTGNSYENQRSRLHEECKSNIFRFLLHFACLYQGKVGSQNQQSEKFPKNLEMKVFLPLKKGQNSFKITILQSNNLKNDKHFNILMSKL